MGIDGIGKRGGPQGVPTPGTAAPTQKTGKSFETELQRTDGAHATGHIDALAPSALDDFKAGRIDMNGYLDRKVQAATAHLEGMPAADLQQIRGMLREQLASDPAFTELVQNATGQLPKPEGE